MILVVGRLDWVLGAALMGSDNGDALLERLVRADQGEDVGALRLQRV